MELFIANEGTNSRLYRNDGVGKFTAITNGPLATASNHASGAAWGERLKPGLQAVRGFIVPIRPHGFELGLTRLLCQRAIDTGWLSGEKSRRTFHDDQD